MALVADQATFLAPPKNSPAQNHFLKAQTVRNTHSETLSTFVSHSLAQYLTL